MKSERRHELEQNALADWMTDLIETVKPYANHIMVGVLVVALALVAYTIWSRNAAKQAADSWDVMLASINAEKPSELEMTADKYAGSTVGFLARTIAAERQLAEGCKVVSKSKAQADLELEDAIDNFQAVVKDCRNPVILARANYGLGLAHETKRELSDAKTAYEAAIKDQSDGVYADLARNRLDDLKRPDTVAFYDKLTELEQSEEESPVKDAPGTPGERPDASLPEPAISGIGSDLPPLPPMNAGDQSEEQTAPEADKPKTDPAPEANDATSEPKTDPSAANSDKADADKAAPVRPADAKPADPKPETPKEDAAKPATTE